MRVLAFSEESSLTKLADRAYRNLSAESRKKAIAALKKANPRLKNLSGLTAGSLLTVPDVPGLTPRASGGPEPARQDRATALVETLKLFQKRMAARFAAREENLKTQLASFKTSGLQNALNESPALKELVSQANKELRQQAKETKASQKRLTKGVKSLISALRKRGV